MGGGPPKRRYPLNFTPGDAKGLARSLTTGVAANWAVVERGEVLRTALRPVPGAFLSLCIAPGEVEQLPAAGRGVAARGAAVTGGRLRAALDQPGGQAIGRPPRR